MSQTRFPLLTAITFLGQGNDLGLGGNRAEHVALVKQVEGMKNWQVQLSEELEREGASEDRLKRVLLLLEMAEDLSVDVDDYCKGLREIEWRCRALQARDQEDVAIADLAELCDAEWAEGCELGRVLKEKCVRASEWSVRAKQAMSDKYSLEIFEALLEECKGLGVETEEESLLEYHMESGHAWREKAQELLKAKTTFLKGLKGMVREGDRIAVDLPEMSEMEKMIEEYEKAIIDEDKSETENWASCDGCSKWRRLGADVLPEGQTFFCLHVAMTCEDPVRCLKETCCCVCVWP